MPCTAATNTREVLPMASHCLDCNSTYTVPGTCNCFAPGGKRWLRTATVTGTSCGWTVVDPRIQVTYTIAEAR